MPDKLNLSNVALMGTGGVFFDNDQPLVPLKFKCPSGAKSCKDLGCYDAVYENGEGGARRRPVAEIRLLTKFESATLQILQAKGADPIMLEAVRISGFTVINENDRSEIQFVAQCKDDDPAVHEYIRNQRKEPAFQLQIIGAQQELNFSSPKRGRPKKSRKNDDQTEAA